MACTNRFKSSAIFKIIMGIWNFRAKLHYNIYNNNFKFNNDLKSYITVGKTPKELLTFSIYIYIFEEPEKKKKKKKKVPSLFIRASKSFTLSRSFNQLYN
jgi:hypothetical protein